MKTLVLANQKGGVGKSAVATLLAQHLAREGRRVLAIDLDHQNNFGSALALSKRPTLAAITSDRLLTAPGARVAAEPCRWQPTCRTKRTSGAWRTPRWSVSAGWTRWSTMPESARSSSAPRRPRWRIGDGCWT